MLHHIVVEGSKGEPSSICRRSSPPSLVKSSECGQTLLLGAGDVLYWLMLRFSKQRPFFEGTVLYIGLWVFVWAAHGHMHTWRSKTSQQSRFPPLVSAHKASPWQLRQNLSTWKQSMFFFSCFNLFIRFFAFTEISFPTIIISNDNNLYSINYLYCTIISPRINL